MLGLNRFNDDKYFRLNFNSSTLDSNELDSLGFFPLYNGCLFGFSIRFGEICGNAVLAPVLRLDGVTLSDQFECVASL